MRGRVSEIEFELVEMNSDREERLLLDSIGGHMTCITRTNQQERKEDLKGKEEEEGETMRASSSILVSIKPKALPKSAVTLPTIPSSTAKAAASKTTASNPKSASTSPSVADQLSRQATQSLTSKDGSWPANLRIEHHVNNKSLFWKVSKEQRDELKNVLKEA
ncbi:hypothetical protein IE53DRAFT_361376 [Violaceomyces palustris]|uniref:Uncharacterized protein n=1 Tax=Violaceomyces palustris TaxID=1673888 RepID=A0ACD0P0Z0_9BASI|nr:hypothetical protein IE53DRAFT_361376 [Violaceomyces palustris]